MSALVPSAFMSTALVPAVLVSACALLLLSFNNRIVAVLTRQRVLHRELLEDARKHRAALLNGSCFVSCQINEPSVAPSESSNCKEDLLLANERFTNTEWATGIERQINDLRREACLIRAAVTCLLTAILLFLVSGVVLAMSTLMPHAELPAITIFLLALLSFALAIGLMLTESFLIIHPLTTEELHLRRIISAQSQLSLQIVSN